ncbi:hypothetical protein A2303_03295 [Candidatus Falkowbacteria bacterium RIFOXYB2_FULL_47_14]|uniref:Uncharacterized protein n=1 Tax=Candidatus Falkowbacteria bacterium RIFOXYA2_FULL_47_19 TaxID=1797994 RepID=A0A1F5SK58_9BACT|nr:MAG: hypothetical protein A2227_04390 [Candidatus Falkowbacteria bacterium RIFOXYA2_FULL_47_19]OGF36998.1 MAG: hypothetical protein A2468_01330 [Candidatus Falkowbacteria bacterium RIFOXYC2_FULL_46_15]OGF44034.1 MAG: hypothetical protein A2303_03295 [Candidatus Falkowbacteria bacterium RIFOXYB2_FULL_47_14]
MKTLCILAVLIMAVCHIGMWHGASHINVALFKVSFVTYYISFFFTFLFGFVACAEECPKAA